MECGVWSWECGVGSVECGVWSVELRCKSLRGFVGFNLCVYWKCQVLCSLKTHKNQFGIGTEQLDRYLSSFCAVREGRKFSRRGLCRAGSVVA